jgi:hypothetical protein
MKNVELNDWIALNVFNVEKKSYDQLDKKTQNHQDEECWDISGDFKRYEPEEESFYVSKKLSNANTKYSFYATYRTEEFNVVERPNTALAALEILKNAVNASQWDYFVSDNSEELISNPKEFATNLCLAIKKYIIANEVVIKVK